MFTARTSTVFAGALAALLGLAAFALGNPPEDARGEEAEKAGGPMAENRLAKERSPYLRQHRHNPVDWYPWGREAQARARLENKPIFLSVGYAACHWCHVMEHESFEDEETARLLNGTFVCVKVDREERPDVDALYMRAVHLISGRGGWPMTAILTPEGDPFFAATYLPCEGLQRLVQRVGELWKENEAGLRQQAELVAERLVELADGQQLPAFDGADGELLRIVDNALGASFDRAHGGYGDAPKFPPHAELLYLLDRTQRDGVAEVLQQVVKTLDAMADGGVHDQVGGGFHRYSTDDVWLVPHFEKMLYDNALLAQAYARAFEATGHARYADAARGILAWVFREMRRATGGYASSLDADTEGEEGLTYTWTLGELREALPAADEELAARVFGVTATGNYREEATGRDTGRNILHLPVALTEAAKREGVTEDALRAGLDRIRTTLRTVRDQRPQPGLDDKVITAWNGLLLSAFARCSMALSSERWLAVGRELATYLLEHCRREDGVLLRFPRASGPEVVGFCDDHVHLAEGLLDLAEATGEESWAYAARAIGDQVLEMFEDPAGGFFSTSEAHHERLLARQKETYDSPIPSENGTAARLFLRLADLTSDPRYLEAADRTLAAWRPLMGWSRAARGTVALYRALAQRMAGLDAPDTVTADAAAMAPSVEAKAYLELDRLTPGGRTRLAVRVVVEEGWHIAPAAAKKDENLALTRLAVADDSPILLENLVYPQPSVLAAVEGEALEVLEGSFWIRGDVVVPQDAPPGPRLAVLLLDLQPCDDTSCLAPEQLRLEVRLRVGEEAGPVRHADVFER